MVAVGFDKEKGDAGKYLASTLAPGTLALLDGATIKLDERTVTDAGGGVSKVNVPTVTAGKPEDQAATLRAMVDLMIAANAKDVLVGKELKGDVPDPKETDPKKLEAFIAQNQEFIAAMKAAELINGDLNAAGTTINGKAASEKIGVATPQGEREALAKLGTNEQQPDKIPPVKGADALKLAGALIDGRAGNDQKALKDLGLEIGEGRYVTGDAGKAIKAYMDGEIAKNPQWQWGDADRLKVTEFLLRDKDGPGKQPDGKSDFVKQLDPKSKDQHVDMNALAHAAGAQLKAAGVVASDVNLTDPSQAAANLSKGIDKAQEQAAAQR